MLFPLLVRIAEHNRFIQMSTKNHNSVEMSFSIDWSSDESTLEMSQNYQKYSIFLFLKFLIQNNSIILNLDI